MSAGALQWAVGFIADPRFGIPFLALLEATMFWSAWNPRPPPVLGAVRRSWSRPSADPVSRMYYAMGDEQYSVLVRWSRERIEELYKARAGEPLPTVPFELRPREGLPKQRFALRRLARELSNFEWEAREREAGMHLKWAFWRSRAKDSEAYRTRVSGLLGRAQEQIAALEGAG